MQLEVFDAAGRALVGMLKESQLTAQSLSRMRQVVQRAGEQFAKPATSQRMQSQLAKMRAAKRLTGSVLG